MYTMIGKYLSRLHKNVISISEETVNGSNYIDATKNGYLKALKVISDEITDRDLMHNENEMNVYNDSNILTEAISKKEAIRKIS